MESPPESTLLRRPKMNVTVWVLLGEWLFISLALLVFLGFARWRKRKRLIAELAALLTRVNRSEADRQLRLQARLMENFGLDEDEAESLSIEIMRAERTLFKTFTEIQLEGDIRKIGAFDETVHSLLEKYRELLEIESMRETTGAAQTESPDFDPEIAQQCCAELNNDATPYHFEDASQEEEMELSDVQDNSADPNWDDAFAEVEQEHGSSEMVDEILNQADLNATRSD